MYQTPGASTESSLAVSGCLASNQHVVIDVQNVDVVPRVRPTDRSRTHAALQTLHDRTCMRHSRELVTTSEAKNAERGPSVVVVVVARSLRGHSDGTLPESTVFKTAFIAAADDGFAFSSKLLLGTEKKKGQLTAGGNVLVALHRVAIGQLRRLDLGYVKGWTNCSPRTTRPAVRF